MDGLFSFIQEGGKTVFGKAERFLIADVKMNHYQRVHFLALSAYSR